MPRRSREDRRAASFRSRLFPDPMNESPRGPWYLLTGLVFGLTLGLFYAWVVSPVAYTDVPPDTLQAQYKERYRALIALAYQADGDLTRAQARLALLGDPDPAEALAAQAQRALAADIPAAEAAALGKLAAALGAGPRPQGGSAAPQTPSPIASAAPTRRPPTASPTAPTRTPARTPSPAATPTPQATFTPFPTVTPTATPGAPFVLSERSLVCNPQWTRPLLRVDVRDAAGAPVPGVDITVTWDGGREVFYTGLKPELGRGVADFEMSPGVVYTLVAGQGGQVIDGLEAVSCQDGGYPGSWLLTFVQP